MQRESKMIWPWIRLIENASHEPPLWDGLRATWRRKLGPDGNVIRHHTAVEIHDCVRAPIHKYGAVFYAYATVHMDDETGHHKLDVFEVDDLNPILAMLNL